VGFENEFHTAFVNVFSIGSQSNWSGKVMMRHKLSASSTRHAAGSRLVGEHLGWPVTRQLVVDTNFRHQTVGMLPVLG